MSVVRILGWCPVSISPSLTGKLPDAGGELMWMPQCPNDGLKPPGYFHPLVLGLFRDGKLPQWLDKGKWWKFISVWVGWCVDVSPRMGAIVLLPWEKPTCRETHTPAKVGPTAHDNHVRKPHCHRTFQDPTTPCAFANLSVFSYT